MRYWRFVKNADHEFLNCLNSYGLPAELALSSSASLLACNDGNSIIFFENSTFAQALHDVDV